MLSISNDILPIDPSIFYGLDEFKQRLPPEAPAPTTYPDTPECEQTAHPKTHWIADFVEPEAGHNVDAFRKEIRTFGVIRPVTRVNGKIIDGLDYLKACEAENQTPTFRDVDTDRPAELLISLKVAGAVNEGQLATLVELLSDKAMAVQHGGSRMQESLVPLESMADRAARAGCGLTTQKKAHKLVDCGDIDIVRQVIRGEMTLNAALALKKPRKPKDPKPKPPEPNEDVHHECNCAIETLQSRTRDLEAENALLKTRLAQIAPESYDDEATEPE